MDKGGGWLGGAPHTSAHAHACMHTHTHKHAFVVNMIISCKWPPPLGNPWEFPIMSYACACACGGTPSPPPTPLPKGDPQNQSKFNST